MISCTGKLSARDLILDQFLCFSDTRHHLPGSAVATAADTILAAQTLSRLSTKNPAIPTSTVINHKDEATGLLSNTINKEALLHTQMENLSKGGSKWAHAEAFLIMIGRYTHNSHALINFLLLFVLPLYSAVHLAVWVRSESLAAAEQSQTKKEIQRRIPITVGHCLGNSEVTMPRTKLGCMRLVHRKLRNLMEMMFKVDIPSPFDLIDMIIIDQFRRRLINSLRTFIKEKCVQVDRFITPSDIAKRH